MKLFPLNGWGVGISGIFLGLVLWFLDDFPSRESAVVLPQLVCSWKRIPEGMVHIALDTWEFQHHFLVHKSWIITDLGWKMRMNWEYFKIWHFSPPCLTPQRPIPEFFVPLKQQKIPSGGKDKKKKNGEEAKVASSKSVNSGISGLTRGITFSSRCSKPVNSLNPAPRLHSCPNKAVRGKRFRKDFPLEVVSSCHSFKNTVTLSRGPVDANWFWGGKMCQDCNSLPWDKWISFNRQRLY